MIVPARNEAGNVAAAIARTPVMGTATELIFVEGNSTDDTWATIQRAMRRYDGPLKLRAFQQTGKGKGDAVRLGFAQARGDISMILDADLTVPPEDLPAFYDVLAGGQADFVQGTRLVYPMEPGAMRFFNKLGNVAFSQLFTYLLQQPIKDTLCGTKVLWRKDYERIAAGAGVLRRLRSVRRLRSDLRGGPPGPEDRRDPGALPRSHLRRDEHLRAGSTGAAAADVGDRGAQDQVRVKRAATPDGALTRNSGPARWSASSATGGRGTQNPALRALYGDWYGRVAAELPVARARAARSRSARVLGSRATSSPASSSRCRAGALARSRGQRRGACRLATASLGAIVPFDVLHHLAAPARFFAEAARALRRGGRMVLCEPYISPRLVSGVQVSARGAGRQRADPLADCSAAAARDPFDPTRPFPPCCSVRGAPRSLPLFRAWPCADRASGRTQLSRLGRILPAALLADAGLVLVAGLRRPAAGPRATMVSVPNAGHVQRI